MKKAEPLIWTAKHKEAWRLPADVTVTQWADGNRFLDPDTSAESGPYHSDRTPYMRGPMEAFTDPEVEEIDVMSASQVGKSTSIQNIIAYTIDNDPGPSLYVVPREKDVDYASQKIFRPMVTLCPALLRHTTGSPRDLQTDFFTFDKMTLYFGWAGSPAEMAQKAIRYLYFDEPDKYPPFAGREANPIDLGVKRTRTFWDRKIVKMCTPTTEDGYIYVSYSHSNRQKYNVPCPHCGEFTVWKFAQLKLPKTLRDPDEILAVGDVWYECEICGTKIYEEKKADLVIAGKWIPKGQRIDADGNIHGRPERTKRHSGFHISGLITPWISWPQIMADWFKANTEVGIALGKLLDFNNATLGLPHRETGKKLKAADVRKLSGGFSQGTVPSDTQILVAGADYHKSKTRNIVRIDYEVRAFGLGMKNQVITTGSAPSFAKLDEEIILSPFPWADGTPNEKRPWPAVMVVFIDSGYEPDDVYNYCLQRPGFTIPTKGETGPRTKPLQPSDLESATERRLTQYKRRKYKGMQLLIIDTSYFKNQVTSWAGPIFDEGGKVIAEPLTSFYDEIPSYYFTEFTNEHKVKTRDTRGNIKWVWQPVTRGAQTHSLDLAVLCAAAAYYKGVHYLRKPREAKSTPAAMRPKPKEAKKRKTSRSTWLADLPEL